MGLRVGQIIGLGSLFVVGVYVVMNFYRSYSRSRQPGNVAGESDYDASDDLVTVCTFDLAFDAERAMALLKSNGIMAFVLDSNVIGMNQALTWAAGGVRLQVPLRQASRAQAILQESGFKALTELRHHHRCPICASTNITCHGLTKWQMVVGVLFFGALFLFLKRDYSCNDCQGTWSS